MCDGCSLAQLKAPPTSTPPTPLLLHTHSAKRYNCELKLHINVFVSSLRRNIWINLDTFTFWSRRAAKQRQQNSRVDQMGSSHMQAGSGHLISGLAPCKLAHQGNPPTWTLAGRRKITNIYTLGLIDETNLSNLREIYLYIWWERHMVNVVTDFFYFLLPP